MESQRYRHRITFQEKVVTQDSETGDIGWSWEAVELDSDTQLSGVPAEVLTGPGREFNAADAKQAEATARIVLRYFDGLLPTWRITWDGRAYDILSIEVDRTARREYRLRVKDGLTDGT